MNKTNHIKRVAHETRLTQQAVRDVLNASHRLIEQTLREGKSVTFPGFGTFLTRERKEGTVVHVRTKQPIKFAARLIAAFRPGEMLRRAVKGEKRTGGKIGGFLKGITKRRK